MRCLWGRGSDTIGQAKRLLIMCWWWSGSQWLPAAYLRRRVPVPGTVTTGHVMSVWLWILTSLYKFLINHFKFNLPMLASLSFKYFLRADGLLNYPCSHRTALSVFHHSHKMPAFSFLAVCFITFSVYSFWYIFLGLLSLGVSMDHSRGRRWLTFASLS